MPRGSRKDHIYQRGSYWLGYDTGKDGNRRSPNYVIFYYDRERGRIRSVSTSTNDFTEARDALDRHYQRHARGENVCMTCGQKIDPASGVLVLRAIADYLIKKEDASSVQAIRARLAHIVAYIASLNTPSLTCEEVDEEWITGFRKWALSQPIQFKQATRSRCESTVENSVVQLAAAINATRPGKERVAGFSPIKLSELSRTPTKRLTIEELADAFRYATDPRYPSKRAALHRFLMLSVATAARPDAVSEFSLEPSRRQWERTHSIIELNPSGRRQTKKYRPSVAAPKQIAKLLDAVQGPWIPGGAPRSAWRTMRAELGWPDEGEAGMKLIRRSIARLLRDAGTVRAWSLEWRDKKHRLTKEDVEVQLGHRRVHSTTDTYAPYEVEYLADVKVVLEGIIDAILHRVPGAFTFSGGRPLHRTNQGD
jgi:hypothetical protein